MIEAHDHDSAKSLSLETLERIHGLPFYHRPCGLWMGIQAVMLDVHDGKFETAGQYSEAVQKVVTGEALGHIFGGGVVAEA